MCSFRNISALRIISQCLHIRTIHKLKLINPSKTLFARSKSRTTHHYHKVTHHSTQMIIIITTTMMMSVDIVSTWNLSHMWWQNALPTHRRLISSFVLLNSEQTERGGVVLAVRQSSTQSTSKISIYLNTCIF